MNKDFKLKTHCKNGHERTPENLSRSNCRICAREYDRHRYRISRPPLKDELKFWDRILRDAGLAVYAGYDGKFDGALNPWHEAMSGLYITMQLDPRLA